MRRPPHPDVRSIEKQLRATGRGKHVGACSYYHVQLVRTLPKVATAIDATCRRFAHEPYPYNVVKLHPPSRISFLRYENFDALFPALARALSVDVTRSKTRHTDYRQSRNPPILHRKELTLPHDHRLTHGAAELTRRLEDRGAFADVRRIGTRDGWSFALARVGLALEANQVIGW